MKVLSRHIAWEYARVLVFCFSAMAVIYLLAHFLGKIDTFIKYKASLPLIGTFILLRLPRIFYEVLPMVVLLGTLITLSIFSRRNEITAMRSCGVGLPRLLLPMMSVTVVFCLFSLVDAEWTVPYANQTTQYLDAVALRKRAPIQALKKNRIWFRTEENTFCNILKVDPDKRLLMNVSLFRFNDRFELVARKDAERVTWNGRQWVTEAGTDWTFTPSGTIKEEKPFQGAFPLKPPLEEIIDVEKSPKEMGYKELRDYIRILKRNGYPTAGYEVDLHAKISYSVISLIMVFIGIPFALRLNPRGGVAMSIGLGLGIGFLYWMAYSVGLSVGHAGLASPLVSAWAVNLVFGAAAIYWTARVRF